MKKIIFGLLMALFIGSSFQTSLQGCGTEAEADAKEDSAAVGCCSKIVKNGCIKPFCWTLWQYTKIALVTGALCATGALLKAAYDGYPSSYNTKQLQAIPEQTVNFMINSSQFVATTLKKAACWWYTTHCS